MTSTLLRHVILKRVSLMQISIPEIFERNCVQLIRQGAMQNGQVPLEEQISGKGYHFTEQ
jgi:hypothetical protein